MINLSNILKLLKPVNPSMMRRRLESDPNLSSILKYEDGRRENPLSFVGDSLTRMLGGDPDAGVLDVVDPSRERHQDAASSIQELISPLSGIMSRAGGLIPKNPARQIAPAVQGVIGMQGGMLPMQQVQQQQEPESEEENPIFAGIGRGLAQGAGMLANTRVNNGNIQAAPSGTPPFNPGYFAGENAAFDRQMPRNPAVGRLGGGPMSREEWRNQQGAPEEESGIVRQYPMPEQPDASSSGIQDTQGLPPWVSQARAEIDRRENKDWKTKQRDGGDGDNDRDWKDVMKGAGIGFLKAFSEADPRMSLSEKLLYGVGGAGTGAVMGGIDPNTDEKFGNEQRLAQLYAREQREQEAAIRQAQVDAARQRPVLDRQKVDIQQMRAESDQKYKQEMSKLGKDKADALKLYNDAIIQLRERGADQNDERIKLLREAQAETKRRNLAAEDAKKLDRDIRLQIAKIMAENRRDVANIYQQGANTRSAAASADRARETLESIRRQGAEMGASPEDVETRVQAFLSTLSPEVRAAIRN